MLNSSLPQVMALQWQDPRQHPISQLQGQPCYSPEFNTPPVCRALPAPSACYSCANGSQVVISSSSRNNDVLVWDVESGSCIQVLRAMSTETEVFQDTPVSCDKVITLEPHFT